MNNIENNNFENENLLAQQSLIANEDIRAILNREENKGNAFKRRDEQQKQAMIPTRDYENLNETSTGNLNYAPTKNKKNTNRNLTIWLIIVIILCCFACCFLCNVNKFCDAPKDLTKSETKYVDEDNINIDGTIISYVKKDNFIEIKIDNQNSNVVCYNIRGTYLTNNNETFNPIIEQTTNIPSEFFGGQINTNTVLKGSLFFNSSSMKKSDYLILSDVLINNYSYDIVFEF